MSIPCGPLDPHDPAVEVFKNKPTEAPLYIRVMARLFGKKIIGEDSGVRITSYKWRNHLYVAGMDYRGDRRALGLPEEAFMVPNPEGEPILKLVKRFKVNGVHEANAPTPLGFQSCQRCGTILIDSSGLNVPTGHKPLFFPAGALVEKSAIGVGSISPEVCDVTMCDSLDYIFNRESVVEKKFMENADGVHLMGLDGEHGFCGDAFDLNFDVAEWMKDTEKKTVTCSRCVEAIKLCRGVKTAS